MLDVGCHIGSIAIQIAAMYSPKIVIGVDIDPAMVKAAINYMHKVINDEECAKLVKTKISEEAGNEENEKMLTDEERKMETKLNDLMSRVTQLPKSFQLAIQGELQFLNDAKRTRLQ